MSMTQVRPGSFLAVSNQCIWVHDLAFYLCLDTIWVKVYCMHKCSSGLCCCEEFSLCCKYRKHEYAYVVLAGLPLELIFYFDLSSGPQAWASTHIQVKCKQQVVGYFRTQVLVASHISHCYMTKKEKKERGVLFQKKDGGTAKAMKSKNKKKKKKKNSADLSCFKNGKNKYVGSQVSLWIMQVSVLKRFQGSLHSKCHCPWCWKSCMPYSISKKGIKYY